MEKISVLIGATLLIVFIAWWFFGKRNNKVTEATTSKSKQKVKVTVNGGYIPSTVVLQQGVPASIIFDRRDPSGCFNEVVLPDFGVHQILPVNEKLTVDIDTSKSGEYSYSCGMNMFHGKIVIK